MSSASLVSHCMFWVKASAKRLNVNWNAAVLTDSFVFGRVGFLVQLKLSLDVLCGEGDADLDAPCQAT